MYKQYLSYKKAVELFDDWKNVLSLIPTIVTYRAMENFNVVKKIV
jgi:hypothetical protein